MEQNCKWKKFILISCNKIYNQINYTKKSTDIQKIKYCPHNHELMLKLKIKLCKKRINYYKIKIYDKKNQTKEQRDNIKI